MGGVDLYQHHSSCPLQYSLMGVIGDKDDGGEDDDDDDDDDDMVDMTFFWPSIYWRWLS